MEKDKENNDKLTIAFNNYLKELLVLIKKADECKKIIKKYNSLSDLAFYNIMKTFNGNSNITIKDRIKIISLYYKKDFEGIRKIRTSMSHPVIEEYGHGKDLESRREFRTVDLEVVFRDIDLDLYHYYTREEINKLIKDKKIVIMSSMVNWDNSCSDTDRYDLTPSVNDETDQFEEKDGKYFGTMLKYYRNIYSKENLTKIKKDYIEQIKDKRDIMLSIEKRFNEESFQKKLNKLTNK